MMSIACYPSSPHTPPVCKIALRTAEKAFGIDQDLARCYFGDIQVNHAEVVDEYGRRLQTDMYEMTGTAQLNFDYTIPPDEIPPEIIESISKTASAIAAGK